MWFLLGVGYMVLGVALCVLGPIKLPSKYPLMSLQVILDTEAATAFDELTRKGITEGLNAWPRIFRGGQFVPAVEYLRANRLRTLIMREMEELMAQVDLLIAGRTYQIACRDGEEDSLRAAARP